LTINQILIAFLIGVGLSAIAVVGDVLIKNVSLQNAFLGWKMLLLDAVICALTAFG